MQKFLAGITVKNAKDIDHQDHITAHDVHNVSGKWITTALGKWIHDSDIKIEVGCLTFISLTFAIFTSFMFVDQIIKIISNVTALELMKDKSLIRRSLNNPRKASWYTLLSRTFGSSNFITWFLPFISTPIRPSYEYDTYSYEDCV
eukprot:gene7997-8855_t